MNRLFIGFLALTCFSSLTVQASSRMLQFGDEHLNVRGAPKTICKMPKPAEAGPLQRLLNPYSAGPTSIFGMLDLYDPGCEIIRVSDDIPATGADCKISVEQVYSDFKGDYEAEVTTTALAPANDNEVKSVNDHAKYGTIEQSKKNYLARVNQKAPRPTDVNFENDVLSYKLCAVEYPTNLENMFLANHDAPANIISFWTPEYIKYRWKPFFQIKKNLNAENNFQAMFELNVKASEIWNSLVACADNNAEQAREAYAKMDFQCAGGEVLRQDLQDLHESVLTYFTSSFFKPPTPTATNMYELEEKLRTGKRVTEVNIVELPSLHPLFLQVLFELESDFMPVDPKEPLDLQQFARLKGLKSVNEYTPFIGISQFGDFTPSLLNNPLGLWPIQARAVMSKIVQVGFKMSHYMFNKNQNFRSYGAVAFGANFTRLPDFYSTNDTAIALKYRELGRKYRGLK